MIQHRLGEVEITQPSVIIAISSPHRKESLEVPLTTSIYLSVCLQGKLTTYYFYIFILIFTHIYMSLYSVSDPLGFFKFWPDLDPAFQKNIYKRFHLRNILILPILFIVYLAHLCININIIYINKYSRDFLKIQAFILCETKAPWNRTIFFGFDRKRIQNIAFISVFNYQSCIFNL